MKETIYLFKFFIIEIKSEVINATYNMKSGKIFKLFLLILITWSKLSICQSNYLGYHKNINKAEQLLISGDTDSALSLYKKNFESFSFVFPRDALIAAQFSYRFNKKELTLFFIVKKFSRRNYTLSFKSNTFIPKYISQR